ncbi:Tetratricopeptide Repeat Protein 21B [Manis pentadactyla]|nr:Tetratricopeptide Repeat Protein 21B [Manis pentadactyla]
MLHYIPQPEIRFLKQVGLVQRAEGDKGHLIGKTARELDLVRKAAVTRGHLDQQKPRLGCRKLRDPSTFLTQQCRCPSQACCGAEPLCPHILSKCTQLCKGIISTQPHVELAARASQRGYK